MVIKAQIATVQVGSSSIEGLMIEGPRFGVAVPQYADLFETSRNTASRDIKRLLGKPDEWEFEKWITPFNQKPVNVLTIDQLFEIALALYNKKPDKKRFDFCLDLAEYLGLDTKALKQLHVHNKHKGPRANTKQEEKAVQLAYHARLGGQIEFPTPIGRIDLLTDDSLYEFKHCSGFKEAVGQVLTYKRYVSVKYLYIVLFGCPKDFKYKSLYTEMSSTCEDYGIRLRIMS